jgi:hypothetical protein
MCTTRGASLFSHPVCSARTPRPPKLWRRRSAAPYGSSASEGRPDGAGVRRPSRGGRRPYAVVRRLADQVFPRRSRSGQGRAGRRPPARPRVPRGQSPGVSAALPDQVSPGPAEQCSWSIAVRRFAGKEVVPVIGPCWERAKIPWQLAGQLPPARHHRRGHQRIPGVCKNRGALVNDGALELAERRP